MPDAVILLGGTLCTAWALVEIARLARSTARGPSASRAGSGERLHIRRDRRDRDRRDRAGRRSADRRL